MSAMSSRGDDGGGGGGGGGEDGRHPWSSLWSWRIGAQRILERMRALGFWPRDQEPPLYAPEEQAEIQAIQRELGELETGLRTTAAQVRAVKLERKRRADLRSAQREADRAARTLRDCRRREAWAATKAQNVVHTGLGVSAGLGAIAPVAAASDVSESDSATAKLCDAWGLPRIATPPALAEAMGIPIGLLRFLTYHRRAAALVHYHRYTIPKTAGGTRAISAPYPKLAQAQRWVLEQILMRVPYDDAAHGFVPGRSIVTNAAPHVGQAVVVNLDLKDFFPSVTFRRVKGLFQALGYPESVAVVLALLCTEPPRAFWEADGRVLAVALGDRTLPQGACTSPAITNLVCRRLDRRLGGLARSRGWTYTRYADDLTFSRPEPQGVPALLPVVRSIVNAEGFQEHPRKTHVMRLGSRQNVTGLVVNAQVSRPREEIRTIRAILHNAARDGLQAQNRRNHPRFLEYLQGRIAFLNMIQPAHAARLADALDRVRIQESLRRQHPPNPE